MCKYSFNHNSLAPPWTSLPCCNIAIASKLLNIIDFDFNWRWYPDEEILSSIDNPHGWASHTRHEEPESHLYNISRNKTMNYAYLNYCIEIKTNLWGEISCWFSMKSLEYEFLHFPSFHRNPNQRDALIQSVPATALDSADGSLAAQHIMNIKLYPEIYNSSILVKHLSCLLHLRHDAVAVLPEDLSPCALPEGGLQRYRVMWRKWVKMSLSQIGVENEITYCCCHMPFMYLHFEFIFIIFRFVYNISLN